MRSPSKSSLTNISDFSECNIKKEHNHVNFVFYFFISLAVSFRCSTTLKKMSMSKNKSKMERVNLHRVFVEILFIEMGHILHRRFETLIR